MFAGQIEMQGINSMKTELFFGSEEQAGIVLSAISPDFRQEFKRSRSSVIIKKNALEISIEAQDLTALRASFNAVMKSIAASGKVLNAFGQENR